jgi:membrane-associated phospholipid phosphatase
MKLLIYKWVTGLSVAGAQILLYMGIGRAELPRSTELLRTAVDDAIPFLPWTSFCYLPFYLGVFVLALFAIECRRVFHRALAAMALVGVVAAFFHALLPATYPRPILVAPYANLGERFMAFVQSVDPPGNVFPSLHVAHSVALSLVLHRHRPQAGRAAWVMTAALTVSTLTTKQHFIADLFAGAALGWGAATLALRSYRKSSGSSSAYRMVSSSASSGVPTQKTCQEGNRAVPSQVLR